jgi:arsenate reductase (glutaredoxin)
MITIYHFTSCRKSQAGIAFLRQKELKFSIRDYIKTPFTEEEMQDLLVRLNKKPVDLIRIKEKDFIVRFRNKHFEDHEWIRILIEYPRLIRRPIVVSGLKAVIGEDIEAIAALLQ